MINGDDRASVRTLEMDVGYPRARTRRPRSTSFEFGAVWLWGMIVNMYDDMLALVREAAKTF